MGPCDDGCQEAGHALMVLFIDVATAAFAIAVVCLAVSFWARTGWWNLVGTLAAATVFACGFVAILISAGNTAGPPPDRLVLMLAAVPASLALGFLFHRRDRSGRGRHTGHHGHGAGRPPT
ncbi:hypothetical protein [Marinactinospora rubrisoli]|uniref:Integral membrane protein n=1 Tax=Marinactinospora rubrisoli TaxID=2715399 RepID=A0ABW2KPN7_9ACTN